MLEKITMPGPKDNKTENRIPGPRREKRKIEKAEKRRKKGTIYIFWFMMISFANQPFPAKRGRVVSLSFHVFNVFMHWQTD